MEEAKRQTCVGSGRGIARWRQLRPLQAQRLTLLDGSEAISVATATAVAQFATLQRRPVEVIFAEGSAARSGIRRHPAHVLTAERSALAQTLLFRVETVGVAVASAVTEGLTALRLTVEVPGRNAGSARTRFHVQRTNICAVTANQLLQLNFNSSKCLT